MGTSKLTDADRNEIRKLFADGMSAKELSVRYDVNYVTIKRIVDPEKYARHLASAAQYNKDNRKQIYQKSKLDARRYYLIFNRERDARVIEKLDKQDNITDYIRTLINKDIKKSERK